MCEHLIPAGLLDSNAEFFATHDMRAFCTQNGQVKSIEAWGESLLTIIENDIARHPEKSAALATMGKVSRLDRIEQYVVCNYGGFDATPDLVDGKLQATEYWPCPMRGKCAFEGKLCDSLTTDSGEVISKREIEVMKLTAQGKLNKEIADELDIDIKTVETHTCNIRRKTGAKRKTDLTRIAIQNNLI